MMLIQPKQPPKRDGIDLRCCSCTDMDWPEADLVIADPPWTYDLRIGGVNADDHYACVSTDDIAKMLLPVRRRAPLMSLWITWPLLSEWWAAWTGDRPVTGLAWTKSDAGDSGHYGTGYWAAGCSEPVLLYSTGGGYCDRSVTLRNAWIEAPGVHSRKPAAWQAQMIRRWVPEGGLVLDPFAGLGSVAEAVLLAGGGRRYLGTEIDPERHAAALALLAQVRA